MGIIMSNSKIKGIFDKFLKELKKIDKKAACNVSLVADGVLVCANEGQPEVARLSALIHIARNTPDIKGDIEMLKNLVEMDESAIAEMLELTIEVGSFLRMFKDKEGATIQ